MTKEQEQQLRVEAKQRGYDKTKTDAFIQFVNSQGAFSTPSPAFNSEPAKPQRNILQKAAGFLGIEKAGQATASAIREVTGRTKQSVDESARALQDTNKLIQAARKLPLGSPERTRLLKATQNQGSVPQEEIDPGTKLSNREVIGSFGNVALNVATPGAFKGGLVTRMGKSAALGSAYGVAGGLEDNKKGMDLVRSGLVGGTVGVALPFAGRVVSKSTGKVLPGIAQRLEQASLRLTPVQKQNLGKELDEVSSFILNKKITGSPEARYQKVSQLYEQTETKLQKALESLKSGYKKDALINELRGLKADPKYKDSRDYDVIQRQIDGLVDLLERNYSSVIPFTRLNNLKRSTYQNAYNKAGDKVLDDVEHDIGDVLRSAIEKGTKGLKIDGKDIASFNKEYGTLIKSKKLLKIAQTRNQIGLVGKMISAFAGASIGSSVGNVAGGIAGAAIGNTVAESIAGTAVRSTIGKALNNAGKIGTGKSSKLLKSGLRRAIFNSN